MTNEVRKVVANLHFHENCHYAESKWQYEIDIPKQETKTEIINITNLDAPKRINSYYQNNNINYFNDKIQITVQITNAHTNQIITYGRVNVYFKEENQNAINLTPQSLEVSNDGLVEVIHQPHNNGYYYAEYISDEDNEYYLASTSNNVDIIFETIPVIMDFDIDKSFVHPEESVILSASLQDVYGNNIDYGTVTFYTELTNDIDNPNDGYEYVLGDPIVINNGIATIEYSPIQSYNNQLNFYYNSLTGNLIYEYDDTKEFRTIYITSKNQSQYANTKIGDIVYIPDELNNQILFDDDIIYLEHDNAYNNIQNIEYIYAHYNYPNEIYGNNFKYYSPQRCKAPLAILNPDNININIGVYKNNTFKNIYDTYDKNDGFLHVQYDEPLILQAAITDIYNNIITDFTANDTITFNIRGTTSQKINENFNRNDITKTYNFNEINHNVIGRYNNQIFECIMDMPLEPGYYTIDAHFNGNDKLSANESVTLYVCVEEAMSSVIIDFNSDNFTMSTISQLTKQSVLGTITQNPLQPIAQKTWSSFLNKRKCYLYLNDIKHECKIYYNTTDDNYQIKLLNNVNFTQSNNYYARIVLPGQRYGNMFLPTTNSNQVLLQVRLALKPYIKSLSIEKNTYPGKITGIVNVDNVFDETPTVTITIDNNGQKISQNYIYNNEDIIFTFDNIDASINQHQIYVTIDNNKSEIQNFIIKRANLKTYLNMDYKLAKCDSKNKTSIITGLNRNISFIVESDSQDFTNYNINNINSINLAPCNEEDYIHPTPIVTKINNNTQLKVSYQQTLSLPLDWKTGIVFNGDNNYNCPTTEYFSFKTKTIKPSIIYIRDDDNKQLHIKISDNKNNTINQYVLIETTIENMNGELYHNNIITDTDGSAIIDCNIEAFESDMQWQNIYKITFTTKPFNQDNIDAIKNSNNKKNTFKQLYPNLQCGNTGTINDVYISGILNQLIANNYQCFYTTYSNMTDIQYFQAPKEEEDFNLQSNDTYGDDEWI